MPPRLLTPLPPLRSWLSASNPPRGLRYFSDSSEPKPQDHREQSPREDEATRENESRPLSANSSLQEASVESQVSSAASELPANPNEERRMRTRHHRAKHVHTEPGTPKLAKRNLSKRVRHAIQWKRIEADRGGPFGKKGGLTPLSRLGPSTNGHEKLISRSRRGENRTEAAHATQTSISEELFPGGFGKQQNTSVNNAGPLRYTSNTVKEASGPKNTLSLMDELFPETSGKRADIAQTPASAEALPRIRLPQIGFAVFSPPNLETNEQQEANQHLDDFGTHLMAGGELHLVLLRSVSKQLAESDFRRLGRKGAHIREWTTDNMLKIIPKRHPLLLEHTGQYLILFSSRKNATDYVRRVREVHKLCKLSPYKSDLFPVPSPPGLLQSGEDINELVNSFTLVDSSQEPNIEIPRKPYHSELQELIYHGGYWPMNNSRGLHCVMCTISGPTMLSSKLIRSAMAQDGQDRGKRWSTTHTGGVMSLSDVHQRRAGELNLRWTPPGDEDEENYVQRNMAQKYVITFTDEMDARRFATSWNGRVFEHTGNESLNEEALLTDHYIHTEYLW